MADLMELNYAVSNEDFTRAGEASSDVKKKLKQLGVSPEAIRKVAIALYEGEINMIIHARRNKYDNPCIRRQNQSDHLGRCHHSHTSRQRTRYRRCRKGYAGRIFHRSRQGTFPRIRCRHGTSQYEKEFRQHGYSDRTRCRNHGNYGD